MYRGRFSSDAPPIEMRVMTRDRPQAVQLSNDVPSYRTHNGKFMWKLLSARIAMLLGCYSIGTIAHQTACNHVFTEIVNRGYCVARGKRDDLIAFIQKERIDVDGQSADPKFSHGCESSFQIAFATGRE
jgi:hypothetical protein